jgi:4'-phosphopantetheinyl transferase
MSGWTPPRGVRKPGSSEIHVWLLSLDDAGGGPDLPASPLDAEERARAGRFRFERDRDRFVRCRAALRALLARYLGRPAASVRLALGPHGKPRLAEGDEALQFNVSHSDERAVLAFAAGRAVGVDVERIDPRRASDDIAERFFSADEAASVRKAPGEARSELFFRCWTRKEAYLKARGEGFALPLSSFSVPLDSPSPSRLSRSDQGEAEIARWEIRDLPGIPGYAAALVLERSGGSPSLCFWTLPADLALPR